MVYFGGFVDKLGYFAGFFYILFAGRYSEAAMGGAGNSGKETRGYCRKILYLRICFCNLSVNHRDSYMLYSTNILYSYINIKASKLHVCLLCIKLKRSFMGCVNMHNSFIYFSLYV